MPAVSRGSWIKVSYPAVVHKKLVVVDVLFIIIFITSHKTVKQQYKTNTKKCKKREKSSAATSLQVKGLGAL